VDKPQQEAERFSVRMATFLKGKTMAKGNNPRRKEAKKPKKEKPKPPAAGAPRGK